MKTVFKWCLVIFSLAVLAFFSCQTAIYPSEFNIICLFVTAFTTIFYIIIVLKEFNSWDD